MDNRDSLDTNFLVFVVIAFIGLFAFGFIMFPRHEAHTPPPTAASSTGPSSPGTNPANTPQKK